MTELRPCPFCGSDDSTDQYAGSWGVRRCGNCKAAGPAEHLGHGGDWDKAWNTRPAEDELLDALELAEDILSDIPDDDFEIAEVRSVINKLLAKHRLEKQS